MSDVKLDPLADAIDAACEKIDELRAERDSFANMAADWEAETKRLRNSHARLIEALEAVANDVHRKRGTISLGTLNIVAETLAQAREDGG